MDFKLSIVIPALLLPMFFGCEKSGEENYGGQTPPLADIELTVNIAASDKLLWSEGDSISVFDGYASRIFRCNGSGASAVFSGKACESDNYSAVWPASLSAAYSSGKVSVRIPEVQKAILNSIPEESYPMAGVAASGSAITLEPLASLLSFRIEDGNKALGSVTISASAHEILSGYQVVSLSGEKPVLIGTSDKIIMLPEGDSFEPGLYYVAVNPVELSDGLDVRIESLYYAPFSQHVDVAPDALDKGALIQLGGFNPVSSMVEEEPDDDATDPTSKYGFDLAKLGASRHPRLLMDANDFLRLKKMVMLPGADNQVLRSLHSVVMDFADRQLLKTDPLPAPEGMTKGDFLEVARDAINRIFTTAYAWRMSGEDEYLIYAKSNLARLCSLSGWYPSEYLCAAEIQFAVSIAYDWLYYDLSLEERTAARKSLVELGLGTCPESHFSMNAGNWNQVCNAGLLSSALVTYEKNKALAAFHIDASVDANLARLDDIYGSDGAYPEGYGYWEYGTTYQAILTSELMQIFGNAAGIENHAGLRNTGKYMLYMSDATGTFGYADGGRAAALARIPQWWLACLLDDSSVLFNEMRLMSLGRYRDCSRFLAALPCWLSKKTELLEEAMNPPAAKIWSGNGEVPMVLIRDGWNYDDTDTYLAMKGGKSKCSHGHMDAGMFVYGRFGVRWVNEIFLSGGYAPYENALGAVGGYFWGYNQDALRWDVFVMNSLAHSTVSFENNDGTVAGKLHDTDHCVTGKATLTSEVKEDGKLGGVFDMTPVYAGQVASATRSAVLLPGGDAEITDVITALPDQDAHMQWRIPTQVAAVVEVDCVELSSRGKEMYLYTESSDASIKPVYTNFGNSRPAGYWGWIARDWDQTNAGYNIVGYTAIIPAGSSVTLRTLISTEAPGQGSGGAENERPER